MTSKEYRDRELKKCFDSLPARGCIMVVNSKGERKRVKVEDYNKLKDINEDDANIEGYKCDLEWDISHGFTEANKAFYEIEKDNNI